jgi:hypothetical protein
MSIRNKRILLECSRIDYVLNNADDSDSEVLKIDVPSLGVSLHFEKGYPFVSPVVMVDGELSITKFIRQYKAIEPLRTIYRLDVPCVCCSPIRCSWTPCYGIREVLDEYVTVSRRMNELVGYELVHTKLPFDDAVHYQILTFL